eukprot:UN26239
MKKAQQHDFDVAKMWKQSKGQRLSRDEFEEMHRMKKYKADIYKEQQAAKTGGFVRKADFNVFALVNYWGIGVLTVLCLTSLYSLLQKSKKISELQELNTNREVPKSELQQKIQILTEQYADNE